MAEDLIERSKAIEAIKAVKEKGNIFCSVNPEKKDKRTPHAFVILKKALDAVDAIPRAETATKDRQEAVIHCEKCGHRGKETAPGFYRCPYRVFDVRDKDFCSEAREVERQDVHKGIHLQKVRKKL